MAPDINPTMIIINIGTAIFVAVLAFVLNGMREGQKELRGEMRHLAGELKELSDAVLGKYKLTVDVNAEHDKIWSEFHKLRGRLQTHETKLAVLESKAHDEFSAGARGRRETDDRKQE